MKNILLGVTGSVAAIKTPALVDELSKIGDVRVVATESAIHFLKDWKPKAQEFNIFTLQPLYRYAPELMIDRGEIPIYSDPHEWSRWQKLGDPVLHIELRRWASCLVIAPLDANTLAKISVGMCDNLLTCVYRAWDWNKPVIMAPAMNVSMWENDPTYNQIHDLREKGVKIIHPIEKRLACDDIGMGAMAPLDTIRCEVDRLLRWKFPLAKCNGIPINHHPGAFGFHRRKNHHTGVDLYCDDGEVVMAVENGTVVKKDIFTGPKVGHDWWEETWGVMVEGASGVVNYGEITPCLTIKVGEHIERGQHIGRVKRVLFADKTRLDIPGHSTSMLHLELYKHGTRDFADWHDVSKNPDLLDPTPYLMEASGAPTNALTWDNPEGKSVG